MHELGDGEVENYGQIGTRMSAAALFLIRSDTVKLHEMKLLGYKIRRGRPT